MRLIAVQLRTGGSRLHAQLLRSFGDARFGGVDLLGGRIDAGGDHRHAHDALKALVERGAQNNVGFLVHFLTDAAGGLIHFIKGEVIAAGDRDQQAARAAHRGFVEQRIGDGGFRRQNRATLAGGLAGAHHRLAHFAHDGAHVGEVEVDEAFLDHQIGDAGHARIEHLVGHRERIGERCLLVGDAEQILVGDDDQRIDRLLQFGDAALGQPHAAHAFKLERLGDDAHGEDAHFTCYARHHRGCPGAGAAAHARRDEHHVDASEMITDFIHRFFSGGAADFGLGAGAKTLGDLHAHLDDAVGLR